MLYLRDVLEWSLPRIGRVFERDHTTVMHGLSVARTLAKHDSGFRAMVKRVSRDD